MKRRPSKVRTWIQSAPSTTCALVTMMPLGSMMNPDPVDRRGIARLRFLFLRGVGAPDPDVDQRRLQPLRQIGQELIEARQLGRHGGGGRAGGDRRGRRLRTETERPIPSAPR